MTRRIYQATITSHWLLVMNLLLLQCQGYSGLLLSTRSAGGSRGFSFPSAQPAPLILKGFRPLAVFAAKQTDTDSEIFQKGETLLNGQKCFDKNIVNFNVTSARIHKKDLMPNAPALNFQKFVRMQEKRVVVSFRFTDMPYLKPYFLTFASKLKKKHNDIIVEKRILPVVDSNTQPIFEVLVDGKIVIGGGSSRERHVLGGRVDVQKTQSIFVSMEHLGLAIAKARKKRRPTTVYGQDEPRVVATPKRRQRSQVLRNGMEKENE